MNKVKQQTLRRNVQGREIDLREYFRLVKKKLWLIILVALIATAAGYYFNQYIESNNVPAYKTSTRIIIGEEAGDMNTLMVMVKDPLVLEKVSKKLGIEGNSGDLAGQIEVARLDESQVIEVIVTSTDPALAAATANATAQTFKSEAASILNVQDIQLLAPAIENSNPINVDQTPIVKVAFVLGIVAGTGLVFILDSLDSSVRNPHDIEEMLGIPVLGSISNLRKAKMPNKKINSEQNQFGRRSEVIDSEEKAKVSQI